jgi:ADP-heptose:LPS heptosyltransferase
MHNAVATGARIVLARPDHLGDVLLTLPAAAALRRALPNAQISFLVPAEVCAVPCLCPDIDETCAVSFPPLTDWPDPPGWMDVVAREAAALRGRFDLAILPRPDDPVSGALVAAADIPIRLGYDRPSTRPFLTVALPVPGRCHVVALALRLAAAAARCLRAPGIIDAEMLEPLHLVPTRAEEAEAHAVLNAVAVTPGITPLVLHPGSGWSLKHWPVHCWGELAATLQSRYGITVLVTGGPGETELVDAVVEASGRRAYGLAGQLSLGGLAALYCRARLVIAIDSGPLHLAALTGVPVIGLYGPADPLEFRPWCPADRYRIVRVQLPCSPCRTLLDPPCGASAEPACITGITVETVLAAAVEFLDA